MTNLYDSKETDFTHNGIVVLNEYIINNIAEQLNGTYELELSYPIIKDGKWQYLLEENIIKSDGQLFRIYHKVKNLNIITVNCRHIFYDLLDNFLEDVRPTSKTGLQALQYILANTQSPNKFTCSGDVASSNTIYFVRTNPVDAIMGTNSLLSNYQGELVRDNFNIGYWQHRGKDNGYLIMGGKNIISINETIDMDNMATRICPTGKDGLMLTEKYVDSQYINNYPHPIIKTIEFSDCETEATLRATTIAYFITSKCDLPLVNYVIDFVELSKTEEYKNYKILQSVIVGDIVTIKYDKYNLNLKATVIKTTKNIRTGNLDKVELGNFKGNIATVVNNMSNTLNSIVTTDGQVKGSMVQGIIDATKTSFQAQSDSAETQNVRAILFEDNDITSATYGAMCLGTGGFGIASVKTNGQWQWATFGTGKGFIANMLIAGKILGGAVIFDLDAGTLRINHSDGSHTLLDAHGLNRYSGAVYSEYHYLNYTGSMSIMYTQTNGTTQITITLPDEFKDKNFSWVLSLGGINFMSQGYDYINYVQLWAQVPDMTNGKLTFYVYSSAYDTISKQNENIQVDVNYTFIA